MGSGSDDSGTVEALQGRGPGEDPEDPYEETDISELPDWWQKAIEEFREHGLRPYRPPRFEDGVLKHEVVDDLEAEHGVDIRFVAYSSQVGTKWEVQVDGATAGEIGHSRSPEGYTVYEMESDTFAEFVEAAL